MRSSNREFDECDDPLVWAAVNLFEREQDACLSHGMKLREGARDRG